MQSGILLRSTIEDCLVLVDLVENNQLEKIMNGKYSASGLITRIKKFVPQNIVDWYGYFSANFTHFGPLHSAPYLPMGCYPDNWVLVCGIQNLVRSVVASHIVFERIYFDKVSVHLLWEKSQNEGNLKFKEESIVFIWAEN